MPRNRKPAANNAVTCSEEPAYPWRETQKVACEHTGQLHTRRRPRFQLRFDHLLAAVFGNQSIDSVEREHLAFFHDGNTAAQALGFLHVMRGIDEGRALFDQERSMQSNM